MESDYLLKIIVTPDETKLYYINEFVTYSYSKDIKGIDNISRFIDGINKAIEELQIIRQGFGIQTKTPTIAEVRAINAIT